MSSSKKQEQQQTDIAREDRVAEAVEMYPVFCTANIPPKILDEFVDEAYSGCFAMVDDGDVGASPCILETTELDSVVHGSRKPIQAFESPFLGKTADEIRAWMKEHTHPNFAQATFTILDKDTIKDRTCRVGYMFGNDKILLTDFYANMYLRVPLDMATVSWDEEGLVGTEKVFDRKYIENGLKETTSET